MPNYELLVTIRKGILHYPKTTFLALLYLQIFFLQSCFVILKTQKLLYP